jgi:hypothetical protein
VSEEGEARALPSPPTGPSKETDAGLDELSPFGPRASFVSFGPVGRGEVRAPPPQTLTSWHHFSRLRRFQRSVDARGRLGGGSGRASPLLPLTSCLAIPDGNRCARFNHQACNTKQ